MSFGDERLDVYHAATKTRSDHADAEIESEADSDSDPERAETPSTAVGTLPRRTDVLAMVENGEYRS